MAGPEQGDEQTHAPRREERGNLSTVRKDRVVKRRRKAVQHEYMAHTYRNSCRVSLQFLISSSASAEDGMKRRAGLS